jgi:3-hydroxyisobutyrate dehydrogenase-like beta-hydroxyacid dehydrogenase
MATDTATTTRIGFVGLGNMGGNMAARFLAAGYPVYGEERSHAHAEGLVHDGLQWRDTPREVAQAADIVFTSAPDTTCWTRWHRDPIASWSASPPARSGST